MRFAILFLISLVALGQPAVSRLADAPGVSTKVATTGARGSGSVGILGL